MKINIEQSFDQISDYWSPKVISRVNDQYVKIAKVKGEFTWHNHKDEDELFLIVRGRLRMQLEGEEIELNAGDMYVVPNEAEGSLGCTRDDNYKIDYSLPILFNLLILLNFFSIVILRSTPVF